MAVRAAAVPALQDPAFAASYSVLMAFSCRPDWAGAAAVPAFHVPVVPDCRIGDSPPARLPAFLFLPVPDLPLF